MHLVSPLPPHTVPWQTGTRRQEQFNVLRCVNPLCWVNNTMYRIMCVFIYIYIYMCEYTHNYIHCINNLTYLLPCTTKTNSGLKEDNSGQIFTVLYLGWKEFFTTSSGRYKCQEQTQSSSQWHNVTSQKTCNLQQHLYDNLKSHKC